VKSELDPFAGVSRFLAQYASENRAEALHLALQALRDRIEPDRVLACELAWEVHAHSYWSQIRRRDGTPYETEEAYFRDVLGLASWRTAYKRLAIGRMLTSFVEPERSNLRAAIAQVGLAKATVVAPAIERVKEWRTWLSLARELPAVVLQARVSDALEALPRGREPSPPGERFRRAVLSAMPDIEAMELVERFFALGRRVVGTPNPIAIFLAGCRECLPEWEIQAARPLQPSERDAGAIEIETDREMSAEDEPSAGTKPLAKPRFARAGKNAKPLRGPKFARVGKIPTSPDAPN